jgi:hypothetical protein
MYKGKNGEGNYLPYVIIKERILQRGNSLRNRTRIRTREARK